MRQIPRDCEILDVRYDQLGAGIFEHLHQTIMRISGIQNQIELAGF